jgi:hypothetical protein
MRQDFEGNLTKEDYQYLLSLGLTSFVKLPYNADYYWRRYDKDNPYYDVF